MYIFIFTGTIPKKQFSRDGKIQEIRFSLMKTSDVNYKIVKSGESGCLFEAWL
jgi:hypothetical protein